MRLRERQRKNIILVVLMVILVGMTIGYSALSSYLTINGTSNIASDFKVVFTDIQDGTMNSATTVNKSFTGTTATFQVKLDKPGSNAEYIVTVQNQGKLDAYLESIEGIDEANEKAPTYITFSVKNLSLNEKLEVSQSKTFKVIVSYNMAAIADTDGTFISSNSGFVEQPDSKYFDLYPTNSNNVNFAGGKLGDATKEVTKKDGIYWYGDYKNFPVVEKPYFLRGGHFYNDVFSGLFHIFSFKGVRDLILALVQFLHHNIKLEAFVSNFFVNLFALKTFL